MHKEAAAAIQAVGVFCPIFISLDMMYMQYSLYLHCTCNSIYSALNSKINTIADIVCRGH